MESMRARGRGRRGRGRGRGASRRKKSDDHKEDIAPEEVEDEIVEPNVSVSPIEPISQLQLVPAPIDMEADISQLEAPTFTTLSRGPPEPMLRLHWNHPVNLLGEKVLNPLIHCCDTCLRPVLIYGRMIPCKHVFCLACAQRDCKACPRCNEKVVRVEQTGLGTVFMCTHGGTRYGNTGCRRTYLSQRDLQAHINHRHVQAPAGVLNQLPLQCNKVAGKPEPRLTAPTGTSPFYDGNKVKMFDEAEPLAYASPRTGEPPPAGPIPPVRPPAPRASNLITVPIQEPHPDPYFSGYGPPPPMVGPPHPLPHGPLPHPPIAHGPPPHQQYYPPPYDYPPPTDISVPPPNQWPGGGPFYG